MVLGASLLIAVAACSSDGDDGKTVDPHSKENATDQAGATAVQKRRCVECHTASMAGSPKAIATPSPGVELYAPNLTNDKETGIGSWTDEQLAVAITTGVDNTSQQLCPQMKHFADMSDFEVYSIIKYLRSLPPVKNKILRSVCPPLKTKEEQT